MAAPPPLACAEEEDPLVAAVIDEFLTWTERRRAGRTLGWYEGHLQSFIESLPDPAAFPVSRLRPLHVERWLAAPTRKGWGPSHRHGAIRAVQRCFRRAEKQGHIQLSPVRHIEKPTPARREKVITPEEYRAIPAHYKEVDPFRDLLVFSWETAARAQESRIIEKRHDRPERKRIEIPPGEAKTKRWRIVFLTDAADAIVRRLVARHPTGPLFRNVDGEAWTMHSTSCRFGRLEKKLKCRYCMTNFRHTWATRMLEGGMDHLTVSALLGHSNGAMPAKVYAHLDQSKDYLADKLQAFAAGESLKAAEGGRAAG